jgi:hypothetical protein
MQVVQGCWSRGRSHGCRAAHGAGGVVGATWGAAEVVGAAWGALKVGGAGNNEPTRGRVV